MSYIVVSAAKEKIGAAEMNMAGDFGEAFSCKAGVMLDEAIARAKANGRKTVRPEDL